MEVRAALGVRERARDTALRDLEHVVERDRVHEDPSIGVDRGNLRAVLVEHGAFQIARLIGGREDQLSRLCVPHSDRPVVTRGQDPSAVRAEPNLPHLCPVCERLQRGQRVCVS